MSTTVKADVLKETEAISFAETKGKELLEVFQEENLAKRYQTLDKIIMEYIDIEYISKFLIGKYWRTMTPEQKNAYKEIFVRYGLALYKNLPLEYAKNITYKIVGANIDGKYTNVLANVGFALGEESQKVTVSFRLHKVNNKIKIVDVKVAESSLLLAYRGRFYEMISQADNEIDWFIEDLTDLAISMEENLKQKISSQ